VVPLEISFDASNSYDPDGNIISYAWGFKDGNTGSGETLNHTFSSIGSYKVELTVTDNKGATSSATKIIIAKKSHK
jgi:PKD repeat protein